MAVTYAATLKDESIKTNGRGTSVLLQLFSILKTDGGVRVAPDPSDDENALILAGLIPYPGVAFGGGGGIVATMRFRDVVDLYVPQKTGGKLRLVLRWDTDYVRKRTAGGVTNIVLPSGIHRAGQLKYVNFWRLSWTTNPPAA